MRIYMVLGLALESPPSLIFMIMWRASRAYLYGFRFRPPGCAGLAEHGKPREEGGGITALHGKWSGEWAIDMFAAGWKSREVM